MNEEIIALSPLLAFVVFLIVGYLLYLLGGRLGLKLRPETGKLLSYYCGEDVPGGKVKQSYGFFHVAFFFTILHVTALMIATMPGGNFALLGVAYILAVAISVGALLRR